MSRSRLGGSRPDALLTGSEDAAANRSASEAAALWWHKNRHRFFEAAEAGSTGSVVASWDAAWRGWVALGDWEREVPSAAVHALQNTDLGYWWCHRRPSNDARTVQAGRTWLDVLERSGTLGTWSVALIEAWGAPNGILNQPWTNLLLGEHPLQREWVTRAVKTPQREALVHRLWHVLAALEDTVPQHFRLPQDFFVRASRWGQGVAPPAGLLQKALEQQWAIAMGVWTDAGVRYAQQPGVWNAWINGVRRRGDLGRTWDPGSPSHRVFRSLIDGGADLGGTEGPVKRLLEAWRLGNRQDGTWIRPWVEDLVEAGAPVSRDLAEGLRDPLPENLDAWFSALCWGSQLAPRSQAVRRRL